MDKELFSINKRNILMLKICVVMSLFGSASGFLVRGSSAWPILLCAMLLLPVPFYLIKRKKLVNQTMYIATFAILLYHFTVVVIMGDLVSYCFTYVIAALLSLYFNYRVLLLMGAGNIVITLYFFNQHRETLFQSSDPGVVVPFIFSHVFLTTALVAQAIIGDKMRIQTISTEALSKTDALTGLNNHRAFHDIMDNLLLEDKPRSLQLAILDIDNFKKINDTYGHHTGDVILKRVASEISNQLQSEDIVARYGGEEFAIIYVNKSIDEAFDISNNIVQALRNQTHPEMDHRSATVSIGLKSYDFSVKKEELFIQADKLLYQAKQNGKNRIVMS